MATLKDNKIQVFPYLGLALGKAFFLYTREVFASKWAREDFLCNGKYSLHGPIREPHRTINRMNNIYGNFISLEPVIYSIKEVNKDISDKEIS